MNSGGRHAGVVDGAEAVVWLDSIRLRALALADAWEKSGVICNYPGNCDDDTCGRGRQTVSLLREIAGTDA